MQFHKYENFETAKSQVILKINDNKKCEKEYYRSFIHKVFANKPLKLFDKTNLSKSLHRSSSFGKKSISATSIRKALVKNQASSLHTKLPSAK